MPTVTSVLKHDIDVADHRPIKLNAYHVNPFKREIMKQETDYLVKHGLAVPSLVHGAHPACWSLNLMGPHVSVPTTEKFIKSPKQIPIRSHG